MTRFRVTYIDRAIRERFVEAPTADDAENIVLTEMWDDIHHHLVEGWIDDLSASEVGTNVPEKAACYLCRQ